MTAGAPRGPAPRPAVAAAPAAAPAWEVSLYAHARDNRPQRRRVSWRALCQSLTTFRVLRIEDKRSCPAWSPAVFPPGATRSSAAVLALSCIVLDLDDGDHARALAAWEDVPRIAHTTWSHTDDAPRLRLVVPLAAPVPAKWWPRVWHWAHRRSGLVADPKCKDLSRLYFVPAVRSHDWPRWARVYDHGGALLDLRPFGTLPPTPEEVEAERRARAPRPPVHRRAGATPEAAARIRAEILRHDPDARRAAALDAGGRVVGAGSAEVARGVPCPSCGRRSVWWPITPTGSPQALCQHRESCGWRGWLDVLLSAVGSASPLT